MVFQHSGGKATINGKELVPESAKDENLARLGKHINLTPEQLRQRYAPEHRQVALDDVQPTPEMNFDEAIAANTKKRVLEDPFMNIDAIAEIDVFQRQRIVHDQGGFVDTWLGEIAVLARDREWLQGQIADPRWADHPGRPDALKKIEAMSAQISEIAESIAYGEAWADRCWQTLAPEEREKVAYMWLTQPADDRLVMRAWKDQAQFGWQWPKGFYVDGRWFKGLPDAMYVDLQPLWLHGPTWLGEAVELPVESTDVTAAVRATFS